MHFAYICNSCSSLHIRSLLENSRLLFLRRGKLWKAAVFALSAWSTSKSQPSPDQTVILLIRCDIYIFLKVNMIRGVSKDLPALLKHVKQQVSSACKGWRRWKLMLNPHFQTNLQTAKNYATQTATFEALRVSIFIFVEPCDGLGDRYYCVGKLYR